MGNMRITNPGQDDTKNIFITNAIKWLAGDKSNKLITMSSWTRDNIHGAGTINLKVEPQQLSDNRPDVYVVDAQEPINDAEADLIVQYVKDGGGLLIGGNILEWNQAIKQNLDLVYANGYPGNKVLTKMGLMIGEMSRKNEIYETKKVPPPEMNLHYAIKTLEEEDGNINVALQTVSSSNEVFNRITGKMPEFSALINVAKKYFKNIKLTSRSEMVAFGRLSRCLTAIYVGDEEPVPVNPKAGDFPGDVEANAERGSKTLEVNGKYEGYPSGFQFSHSNKPVWVSTGMYAAKGEVITVEVTSKFLEENDDAKLNEEFGVQIGGHSDNLFFKEILERPDGMVTKFSIMSEVTKAANPSGGLIYITLPIGANYGKFDVTIKNAVKAPYFVLGKNTQDEWMNVIRKEPAPWGELELPNQFISTWPSKLLREFEKPIQMLETYQTAFKALNYFMGFDDNYRYRAERLTFDLQVILGDFHAGYPMVKVTEGSVPFLKSTERVPAGILHELGHNHQFRSHTLNGFAETTPDLPSNYIRKTVDNSPIMTKVQKADYHISQFIFNKKPFDSEYRATVAKWSYMLYLNAYGWESWRGIMKKYYKIEQVSGNDVKADTFAKFTCEQSEVNLAPYWEWWSYRLSEETKSVCAKYDDMEKDLVARYRDIEYANVEQHRKDCPKGWKPFGESCFLLSKDAATWSEAEKSCVQLNEGSHLASCLSSSEAFWLNREILKNVKDAYFIGMDRM